MKKIISKLMGGVLLFSFSMSLTSCEGALDDILGEWSRPTPGNVTPGTDEGGVTSITVDLSKIDAKYLDSEKTKLQLTVGDEVTLSFTILPEEMADTKVELTADDETILSVEGLKVTAKKAGETKVTAKAGEKEAYLDVMVKELVNLSAITEDYTAQDGTVLTGTLAANVKISIADGATVTLKDLTINGVNDDAYLWAGITAEGDATIILEGENYVKSFLQTYPGIFIAADKTLTIKGDGKLTATAGYGTGIGAAYYYDSNTSTTYKYPCGNIVIESGTIIATGTGHGNGIGGYDACNNGDITINGGTVTATGGLVGIGSGQSATGGKITITGGTVTAKGSGGPGIGASGTSVCGDITITGGTVDAQCTGQMSSGIGVYDAATCGNITITNTVTKVTATKGTHTAEYSIGKSSSSDSGTCGTITIGGEVKAQTELTTSPYIYQP